MPAAKTKTAEAAATDAFAAGTEIRPDGISRVRVLGLVASYPRSTTRLNAIAANRAAANATVIQKICAIVIG